MTPLDYYLWGAVKADKPEAIGALKDNIREAIGEIQLQTIDNVLKNWTYRVGYSMASRGSPLNGKRYLAHPVYVLLMFDLPPPYLNFIISLNYYNLQEFFLYHFICIHFLLIVYTINILR